MRTNAIKNIYDLEYSKLNKVEVVQNLNRLLASYQVFFHKLTVFNWNIVGQDYFSLRRKFRELNENALHTVDIIAERIRIFDQTPVSLFKEMVELSVIDENGLNLAGFEMVKEILTDILTLLSLKEECLKTAVDLGDYGTEQMMKELIYKMERDHRSLISWVK